MLGSFLPPENITTPIAIDIANFKILSGSNYLVGGYGVKLDSDLIINIPRSMDTGVYTYDSLYYIYIVVKNYNYSIVLSLNSLSPFGYSCYKKIAIMLVDVGGNYYFTTNVTSPFISGKIGEIIYTPTTSTPSGCIPANSSYTIGKTGATYSGTNYQNLYNVLWLKIGTTGGDPYVISSLGTSALSDWNANKLITINVQQDRMKIPTFDSQFVPTNGVSNSAFPGNAGTNYDHWGCLSGAVFYCKRAGSYTVNLDWGGPATTPLPQLYKNGSNIYTGTSGAGGGYSSFYGRITNYTLTLAYGDYLQFHYTAGGGGTNIVGGLITLTPDPSLYLPVVASNIFIRYMDQLPT